MADITEDQQSQVVRVTGNDENIPVAVNDIAEMSVNDTPEQGVSAILNLTTTAQELKVGASALANRKLIEMQALDSNVKWGYTTTCEFNLFKSQFFSLPAGENCTVYLKMSSGTGDVAIGEK